MFRKTSRYTGNAFFVILLLLHFLTGHLLSSLDWNKYLPNTCVNELNFTFPEKPIELNISLWVNAVYEISEENMEFGMQIELIEHWTNPHMECDRFEEKVTQSIHVLPKIVIDCIWKPDTMFKNAKESKLYEDTTKNMVYGLSLPKGVLLRRSRYRVTAACSMEFKYYPMDVQKCHLDIALYKSGKAKVLMQWLDDPNKPKLEATPLNYKVKESKRTSSEITYKGYTAISQCLQAHFLFERSLSASVFNTYIPSFLVVCLSMVSFWLDVDAVPGRVTLGVTAILTLSTQIVQARSGLPVLDYMTAMDVWLLGCLILVFSSLAEFVFANSLSRSQKGSMGTERNNEKEKPKSITVVMKPKDNFLDRKSRVVFPIIIAIFGCVYWVYYYNMARA